MPPTPEPSVAALSGGSPLRAARRLLLATRPKFFTASVLPVLLGTVWGYKAGGHFDAAVFFLALMATLCVHAGANVLNDVFDELSGSDAANADRIYPYTGGSRFIQNGVMSVAEMARWGSALVGVGMVFGATLIALKGVTVLYFGLAGVALATLYSMPPVQLSARGLGEAAVGVAFGVLPVAGAAWLQSGLINGASLLMSLPMALWVASILLINEVPDIVADARANKRTLAVRLGHRGTQVVYFLLQLVAVLAIGVAIGQELLPLASIALPALLLLAAVYATWAIDQDAERLRRGIELTLAIHTVGALWLIICIVYAASY
jgi:1,4-dihydroxy-2-naphthoate polyprenyltransferase